MGVSIQDPTDCWLECFFNTMLGNSTDGVKAMANTPFKDAWAASFSSDDASAGGCPRVKVTKPAPPRVLPKTPYLRPAAAQPRLAAQAGERARGPKSGEADPRTEDAPAAVADRPT